MKTISESKNKAYSAASSNNMSAFSSKLFKHVDNYIHL